MALRKARAATATRFASRLLGISFATLACGPSLTTVHEGTVRFEHCNRLDLDEGVGKKECGQCWNTWLKEYTYGQPRDRIDYARRRSRALSNGDDGARPVLKIDERNPEQRQFYVVVPGPTSVHAPPPPIATVWKDGQGDAGGLAKSAGDRPPAENCADDCRTAWKTCSSSCANGNGPRSNGSTSTDLHAAEGRRPSGSRSVAPGASSSAAPGASGCSSTCGDAYSTCMKRCFD